MGDIGHCELIDGRIARRSPTGGEHGAIEAALTARLHSYVRERRIGWVLDGEVGIYIRRSPDRVRGRTRRSSSGNACPGGLAGSSWRFLEVAPEPVIEVLWPDDRWQDIRQRVEEYFEIGVEHVWVVEPENRAVLVYRSPGESERMSEGDVREGHGTPEGFRLAVAELFPD